MNRRQDEDLLWGLAHNSEALDRVTTNAMTWRERSTVWGMKRQWPQVEQRRGSGTWDGKERRVSRISGPHRQ